MADKFYDGMLNVNEKLNEMDRAFAAGPYSALPLTGGALTGPVSSSSIIIAKAVVAGDTSSPAHSFISGVPSETAVGAANEVARFAVSGTTGSAYNGLFAWMTRNGADGITTKEGFVLSLRAYDVGSTFSNDLIKFSGRGDIVAAGLIVSPACQFGPILRTGPECVIAGVNQSQGQLNVNIPNSAQFYVSAGSAGSSSLCAINAGSNTTTGRSINANGTINASGADYAEYLVKSLRCGIAVPGQILGIDVGGQLTDKWDRAIAFVVKSTNPCMVGGDSWAQLLGARPAVSHRGEDDTDDSWAARNAAYSAALATFDAELEQLRQTVDRIAFSGQVPCNVHGATPGQYLVPVRQGEGIGAIAVNEDDLTLKQYMRAIGKVIAIEDDGRARIVVKVA